MIVNGKNISKQLIDNLGLNALENGCYTYLHYAVEYGEGEILTGGKVHNNNEFIFKNITQQYLSFIK